MNGTILREASKKFDHELTDMTECLKLDDYVREEPNGNAAHLYEKAAKRTGVHGVLRKRFGKQPKKFAPGFAGGSLTREESDWRWLAQNTRHPGF